MQKPFLKWVGGKTQILKNLNEYIPTKFNDYHEIFLGGGSVLFNIIYLKNTNKITCNKLYAYDINKTLIDIYNFIKSRPNELYNILNQYVEEYSLIKEFKGNKKPLSKEDALESKESYYYYLRNLYNTCNDDITKAALFLFLNKTCFRGLYREGPNGFNVPFGHYKKSIFLSLQELNNISKIIQDVEFKHMDYESSMLLVKENDFCYLDPPYYPESVSSFTKYNRNDFSLDNHNNLFEMIKELNKSNIKFLFSNSNTEYVINSFSDFKIILINARRAINSKNPSSITQEVLIYN